jgi:uncharacterized protein (TIRG00374 family)
MNATMSSRHHSDAGTGVRPDENRAGPVSGGRKGRRLRWLNLAIPAVILLVLLIWVDMGTVFSALGRLPPAGVFLALLLATVDRIAMALKWRQLITAVGGRLGLLEAVRIQYQAAAGGRVVPATVGGDLIRAWLAARLSVPHGVIFASLAVEKVMAMLASVMFALAGLLYVAGELPAGLDSRILVALVIGGIAAAGTALALLLLAPAHRAGGRVIRALADRRVVPERVHSLLRQLSHALSIYRSRPAALVTNALLALGEQTIQFLKLLVIALGLGIAIAPVQFFAVIAVALFVRRVAGNFDSWGLGEGAGVVAFTILGLQPELAVALFVANFAVSTAAVIPGALLFFSHPIRFDGLPATTEPEAMNELSVEEDPDASR